MNDCETAVRSTMVSVVHTDTQLTKSSRQSTMFCSKVSRSLIFVVTTHITVTPRSQFVYQSTMPRGG